MRHTRKPGTWRNSVGAQHAAPAEKPSGPLPQKAAPDASSAFSGINSPLVRAVTRNA